MKRASVWLCIVVVFCLSFVFGQQQQTSSSVAGITVPRLIKFAGAVKDASGKPQTGVAGITFSLYKEQQGGAALWMETQNVELESNGGYSVLLGATQADGLPTELFTSAEARWLGVQIEKEPEQARVLLVAVPYALKAGDAETLGGKPLSAFQLVTGATSSRGSSLAAQPAAAEQANEIVCSSTTACKTGFVPLFASNGGSAKVTDSIVTQRGGTVTIAGSETATGNISSGGNLSASGDVNANGNVGASTVTTVALTGGVSSTMTGTGNSIAAVQGSATAPGAAGFTFGVIGQSASDNGRGVFGLAPGAAGVGVIGETTGSSGIGVVGKTLPSSSGSGAAGVYGQLVSPMNSNYGKLQPPAGVWGSTGLSLNNGVGVAGTADDSTAGIFLNNSPSGYFPLLALSFDSSGPLFAATNISLNKGCFIDPVANLFCDGSKNAMVPLDGGKRKVALAAIESPENWFEDFGSARLVNGVAVVRFDPDFIQTVNTEKDYRVFPVPNGDCKGLYVTNKGANSFEVHELGGGTSNVSFDYRITAIRRNYEAVRFADQTNKHPSKMLEQMRMAKPASASAPAQLRPASPTAYAVPVAQLTNK
jgi:hypothetical protein